MSRLTFLGGGVTHQAAGGKHSQCQDFEYLFSDTSEEAEQSRLLFKQEICTKI
jgi:hypothetical protein